MLKKIALTAATFCLLASPLVASAQTFTLPQLPPNPTIQDYENEIQALSQILTQIISARIARQQALGSSATTTDAFCVSCVSANFSAAPFSGPAPFTTTLSGSITGTSYTLDFGDGSTPLTATTATTSTTTVSAQHTYTLPGQYRPTITTGNQILSTAINVTSTTTGAALGILAATPTSGMAPLTVKFFGSAAAAAYWIDFGDGNSSSASIGDPTCPTASSCSSAVSATHVYNSGGTFTATLYKPITSCLNILFGCGGGLSLATVTVTVTAPPVATSTTPSTGGGSSVTISTPWAPNPNNPGSLQAQTYWHNFEIQTGQNYVPNPSGGNCTFDNTPVGATCGPYTHEMTGIGSDYWVSN